MSAIKEQAAATNCFANSINKPTPLCFAPAIDMPTSLSIKQGSCCLLLELFAALLMALESCIHGATEAAVVWSNVKSGLAKLLCCLPLRPGESNDVLALDEGPALPAVALPSRQARSLLTSQRGLQRPCQSPKSLFQMAPSWQGSPRLLQRLHRQAADPSPLQGGCCSLRCLALGSFAKRASSLPAALL